VNSALLAVGLATLSLYCIVFVNCTGWQNATYITYSNLCLHGVSIKSSLCLCALHILYIQYMQ